MQTILYITGLSLTLIGTITLYIYGQSPIEPSNSTYIYTHEEASKIKKNEKRLKKKYRNLSLIGLLISILGIIITGTVYFI